jgi:hypothetical protein
VSHFSSDFIAFVSASPQDAGKQRNRRAQPTQADPHLMEALGISGKQSRLVDDYLLDAGGRDHAERISGGGIRRQDDGLRFCRRGIVAVEKLITALGLALYGKFGGCGASDGAGQPEKCSLSPALDSISHNGLERSPVPISPRSNVTSISDPPSVSG